jgi:hypothetical protein
MRLIAQIDRVLLWCIQISILTTLAGFLARHRYRSCLLFGGYLAAVTVSDVAMTFPRFYTRSFWLGKEIIINILTLGMALEIGARTLRAFPGARASARWLMTLAMIAMLVFVMPVWPGDGGLSITGALRLQGRLVNGTVWLLTALAAVVLWYRLPIQAFQKAILVGLVPYLLMTIATMNLLESRTAPAVWNSWRPTLNLAGTLAYLILVTYWAVAAWRPQTAAVQARERQGTPANVQIPL